MVSVGAYTGLMKYVNADGNLQYVSVDTPLPIAVFALLEGLQKLSADNAALQEQLSRVNQGIQVNLIGGNAEHIPAGTTRNGELLVSPFAPSEGTFQDMAVDNQAYNFVLPEPGERFIITGLIVSTDRNVGINGAVVQFYEASSADTGSIDKVILRLDLPKNTPFVITGAHFAVTEGKFVNGKTDDNNALATIFGYQVPV